MFIASDSTHILIFVFISDIQKVNCNCNSPPRYIALIESDIGKLSEKLAPGGFCVKSHW